MRKVIPLLVTAFAGAIPAKGTVTAYRGPAQECEAREEREDRRNSGSGPGLSSRTTWQGETRERTFQMARAEVAALAGDAVLQWGALSRESESRRARWEARRRELVCKAWISDRRASLQRLLRVANPHELTLSEVRREFDLV